ncbi:ClpP/crotonase-like domain-containing protein, partial [Jimgerdemannia flammicorona]
SREHKPPQVPNITSSNLIQPSTDPPLSFLPPSQMHRLQMFRPSNAAALLRRNITSLPMRRSTPHTAAALSTTTNLSQISNTRVAAQRAQALARWFTVGNGRAKMSTLHGTAASTEEQQADVIQRKHLGSRTFILNRPLRLNSLNLSMIRNITPQLQAWDKSDLAKVIIIKGTGHRAFCAGGDVREIIKLLDERAPETLEFFEEEYQLNHLIATLDTPLVAIMDGVTSTYSSRPIKLSTHPLRVSHSPSFHSGWWRGPFGARALPHRHREHCLRHARDSHRPVPGRGGELLLV